MARKKRSKKKPQVASRHSDETTQVQQTESAPPSTTTTTATPTPSSQDPATAEATDAAQTPSAVGTPSPVSHGHSASAATSPHPEPGTVPQTEPQHLLPADGVQPQPEPLLPQPSEGAPSLYQEDTEAAARTLATLFTTDHGRTGESGGHATFTNPSGGTTLPRSDIVYESDLPRRLRTTEESLAARASLVVSDPGAASDHEAHCTPRPLLAAAAMWAVWLAAHAYAAAVAWRFWSSQELVPLAGGRCVVVSIVVSVLVTAQLLAAATVLRRSRLWDGVQGALNAAAGAAGRLRLAVGLLRP
ncbi:uncharacterized protein LOC144123702 [Amblyomma americanum]